MGFLVIALGSRIELRLVLLPKPNPDGKGSLAEELPLGRRHDGDLLAGSGSVLVLVVWGSHTWLPVLKRPK